MDKYKLQFSQLQNEIFRVLSIHAGEKLNQRQVAKLLSVTPTGVAKALEGTEDLVRVEKSKTMNLNLLTLKRNQQTLRQKQLINLELLYDSGVVETLEDNHPGATIILFGSYFRGEDTITSDVDIAIIGSKDKLIDLTACEHFLEREIRVNYYPSLRAIDKNLRNNILNGLVLIGAIDL